MPSDDQNVTQFKGEELAIDKQHETQSTGQKLEVVEDAKHVRFNDNLNQYRSPPQSFDIQSDKVENFDQGIALIEKSLRDVGFKSPNELKQELDATASASAASALTAPESLTLELYTPPEVGPLTPTNMPARQPSSKSAGDDNPVAGPSTATPFAPEARPANARILPARPPIANDAGHHNTIVPRTATPFASEAHPRTETAHLAQQPNAHDAGRQNTNAGKQYPQHTSNVAIPGRIAQGNIHRVTSKRTGSESAKMQSRSQHRGPVATGHSNALSQKPKLPADEDPEERRKRNLRVELLRRSKADILSSPSSMSSPNFLEDTQGRSTKQLFVHPLLQETYSNKTSSTVASSPEEVLRSSVDKSIYNRTEVKDTLRAVLGPDGMAQAAATVVTDSSTPSTANKHEPIGPRGIREPAGVNAFGEPVAMTLKTRPKLIFSVKDEATFKCAKIMLLRYHPVRGYPKEAHEHFSELSDRYEECREELTILQALLTAEQDARIETLAIMNDERESLAQEEAKVEELTGKIEEQMTSKIAMLEHMKQMQQYIQFLENELQSIPCSSKGARALQEALGERRPTFTSMHDLQKIAALGREEDTEAEADEYVRMFTENLEHLEELRQLSTNEDELDAEDMQA